MQVITRTLLGEDAMSALAACRITTGGNLEPDDGSFHIVAIISFGGLLLRLTVKLMLIPMATYMQASGHSRKCTDSDSIYPSCVNIRDG